MQFLKIRPGCFKVSQTGQPRMLIKLKSFGQNSWTVPVWFQKLRQKGSRGIRRCSSCSFGYSLNIFHNRWEKIPLSWISALPGWKPPGVLPASWARAAQQGWHEEQAQLSQLCSASWHCFLREKRKHLMLLPGECFLVELMRKEIWNLQLCWLVNITIRKIPPNIWDNFARAEGSAWLSQAIHTNSGHNYIYVFFGSTLFSFSHRDTFSGGHQSCRNCVVKAGVKFK